MKIKWYRWFGLFCTCVMMVMISSCGKFPSTKFTDNSHEALVIYCPHPLTFINPIILEFELRTGIPVVVETGGTGELLQKAEQKAAPICDVFWGGSLSTMGARGDLFEPYISENEPYIQKEFRNVEGNITRFTDVPSVLMVNTNLSGGCVIEGYKDLLNPALKGKIAMADPSKSSSAYEHLINMLYAMGDGDPEDGWGYVKQLCENLEGNLLEGSSAVYKGVGEGQYVVGLTFEEAGARYVAAGGPVRLVYMEEGVISKADVVCIRKETEKLKEAQAFVDFVTGKDAQTMICESLDRRSVRVDVEEPEYLPDKKAIPIIYDQEDVVNEKKEEWVARFLEIYHSVP